jgi:hypothetical protein
MILVGIRFILHVAGALAVGLATSACLPGHAVTDGGQPVQITGRLDIDLKKDDLGGTACLWLIKPGGTRTNLFLWDEPTVLSDPLRLIDARGTTIARVGDTVTAIGPKLAMGDNGCASSDVTFVAGSIIGPGGTLDGDLDDLMASDRLQP